MTKADLIRFKNNLIKNKKLLIILLSLTILLIGGVVLRFKGIKKREKKEGNLKRETVLPREEVLPTVDSTVSVNLTSKDGKEVVLTVENIPLGTETLDYELSYLTSGNLPKGVVGTIEVAGKDKIERKITLGTCSSGTCVYDQGVKKIKVDLKFNGDYGGKLFEKEFEI